MDSAKIIEIGVDKIKKADPILADIINRVGPCILLRREQGFPSLAYSIIGQQISKSAAASIRLKFESIFSDCSINPVELVNISDGVLRQTGLSRQKIDYLRNLAILVVSGEIDFQSFEKLTDEEIIQLLMKIKGVGRWTAEMYLMFSMNRLDVFPVEDKAVRRAINEIYDIDKSSANNVYVDIADRWSPYRTVGSWYLYKYIELTRTI
jgi:DNA-3-methyladenine glycosylase II